MYEGSPGCGKSMISKRIRYILPPMSLDEILEKAKLQSLDYKEIEFSALRVFRNPHHSSTKSSIFSGVMSFSRLIIDCVTISVTDCSSVFSIVLPNTGTNFKVET